MTFSYKALLLVLLTSLALGAYAHSSRSECDCDKKEQALCRKSCCVKKSDKKKRSRSHGDCEKKERTFCKETCCDVCIDEKDCKAKPASSAFECCLSFEQVVVSREGVIQNRPAVEKPHGVCGRFKICFAPDLSQAEYELTITGLDIERFPNQRPLGASLLFMSATNIPSDFTQKENQRIAPLCGLDNLGLDENPCTTPNAICTTMKNGVFCCKSKLTNESLNTNILESSFGFATIPTIAALNEACRAGKVAMIVNGGNSCDNNTDNPGYGCTTSNGGMLRCQISGEEVAGVTADALAI